MKVYIATCDIDQGAYTEARYYASARPCTEIAGVFQTKEEAWTAAVELKHELDMEVEMGEFVDAVVLEWDMKTQCGTPVPSM